jgi:hypothetical protein
MKPGFGTEVEEKSERESSHSQVIDELSLGVRRQYFSRFDFQNDPIVDDHVESLSRHVAALVADVDSQFPNDGVSTIDELVLEGTRVTGFPEPVPEIVVDRVEPADDRPLGIRLGL